MGDATGTRGSPTLQELREVLALADACAVDLMLERGVDILRGEDTEPFHAALRQLASRLDDHFGTRSVGDRGVRLLSGVAALTRSCSVNCRRPVTLLGRCLSSRSASRRR